MKLGHATIVTEDPESARRFLCAIVGLSEGPRPPFSVNAHWLYANGQPVIHLIEEPGASRATSASSRIDHVGLPVNTAQEGTALTVPRVGLHTGSLGKRSYGRSTGRDRVPEPFPFRTSIQGLHRSISSPIRQREASRARQSAVDTRRSFLDRYCSHTELFLPGQFHTGISSGHRSDTWSVPAQFQVQRRKPLRGPGGRPLFRIRS